MSSGISLAHDTHFTAPQLRMAGAGYRHVIDKGVEVDYLPHDQTVTQAGGLVEVKADPASLARAFDKLARRGTKNAKSFVPAAPDPKRQWTERKLTQHGLKRSAHLYRKLNPLPAAPKAKPQIATKQMAAAQTRTISLGQLRPLAPELKNALPRRSARAGLRLMMTAAQLATPAPIHTVMELLEAAVAMPPRPAQRRRVQPGLAPAF